MSGDPSPRRGPPRLQLGCLDRPKPNGSSCLLQGWNNVLASRPSLTRGLSSDDSTDVLLKGRGEEQLVPAKVSRPLGEYSLHFGSGFFRHIGSKTLGSTPNTEQSGTLQRKIGH